MAPLRSSTPRATCGRTRAGRGVTLDGQVLYELHVGTFTPEGTYAAAAAKLPRLKELGVTTLELLPLHTTPGRFNWGYDGTHLFAPAAAYGTPDDLRRFVDEAHRLGLGVIVDAVYNHLGPDGNYLAQFSQDYFNRKYPGNGATRPTSTTGRRRAPRGTSSFKTPACGWPSTTSTGCGLDATQSLFDASPRHIIAELVERTRAAAGRRRVSSSGRMSPRT
jgi:maltooligosyltrehalose trehalohydrolase